jgi:protein transport protein SEC24
MSQLPDIFSNNKTQQVVLEPVLRAGMEALKAAGRNGRLFVFHSSLPTQPSTGVLKNRLDSKLLGTDKEKVCTGKRRS